MSDVPDLSSAAASGDRPLVITSSSADAAKLPVTGAAPRLDFIEIAAVLGAKIAHPQPPSKLGDWLDRKILRGGQWRYAWSLRRATPTAFLTLSETGGLPLSLLARRGVPHVMIGHNLTTPRRRDFQRRTGFLNRIDRIIVLSRTQETYLRTEVGLPAERVVFVHDKVDHRFFVPQGAQGSGGYVLAVGREQRDYATLVEAVRDTGQHTIIVPSSLWMSTDQVGRRSLPQNVEIRAGLSFTELRTLYDAAAVVAVPVLPGVDYAAGVNAVLEGMSMAKPVVVSDSPGLEGYLDPSKMRIVPPGDPLALGAALSQLAGAPEEARSLGQAARAVVDAGRNLDSYIDAVVATVRESMGTPRR
jgi:glycosyltransferase involved in cell wall biosynthesis